MSLLEDVANRVAAETLKLVQETGNEDLEKKVADEIGASSPTLQEAFTTSLRILKAEARALRYIDRIKDGAPATPKAPPADDSAEDASADEPIILGNEREVIEAEQEEELIALPGPKRVVSRTS
ncbi:MAG: hypothetical protein AAF762_05005 [Pseudomonadota bacterium]